MYKRGLVQGGLVYGRRETYAQVRVMGLVYMGSDARGRVQGVVCRGSYLGDHVQELYTRSRVQMVARWDSYARGSKAESRVQGVMCSDQCIVWSSSYARVYFGLSGNFTEGLYKIYLANQARLDRYIQN